MLTHYRDLKEHLRRLQQQVESRRRAAVKEMMRQRTAEAAAGSSWTCMHNVVLSEVRPMQVGLKHMQILESKAWPWMRADLTRREACLELLLSWPLDGLQTFTTSNTVAAGPFPSLLPSAVGWASCKVEMEGMVRQEAAAAGVVRSICFVCLSVAILSLPRCSGRWH